MLILVSRGRSVRSQLEKSGRCESLRQFESFDKLESFLEKEEGKFSVIVDEDITSGPAGTFVLNHLNDNRLGRMVILTSSEKSKSDIGMSDKIMLVRKDQLIHALPGALPEETGGYEVETDIIVGTSPVMARLREQITKVALSGCNVIINGPTGCGKELVAQCIQKAVGEERAPVVNCALLEGELFESFLFGHCRGSFTGAFEQRSGLVEQAKGGALILDEIEVLATSVQAKLLRFIETGEFRRLGENTVRRAKCRIIAISNENIGKLYSERRIRPDFYMRIAGATIMVPPLRDHIDDIEDLVRIHEQRRGYSERIRDIESFKAYSWPGNVRELFNTVDRIHTLGMSQKNLRVDDLRMESCFVSL